MKNKTFLLGLFLMIIISLSQSCKNYDQKNINYSDNLAADSQKNIINDIMNLTDTLAINLCKMNFENALAAYDSSQNFKYAANGEFFTDYHAWKNYLFGHNSTTDSLNFQWTQRDIIPLSQNSAALAGNFDFRLKLKTGDIYKGKAVFTGVFVRKNNKWTMIHGHESIKQ
jgi:hypothetical protein